MRSGLWSETDEDITEPVSDKELTPLESKIYAAMAEGRYTTLEEAAKSLGTSTKTVHRATVKLSEMELIRRVGSKKSGLWELIPR